MAKIFELQQERTAALNAAEAAVMAAENANRPMTESEQAIYSEKMAAVTALNTRIDAQNQVNTARNLVASGAILPGNPEPVQAVNDGAPRRFSKEYRAAFAAFSRSRGQILNPALAEGADELGGFVFPARANAAAYEGNNASGGYAVPSQVSGDFVPLAPPEMGVYSLVSVTPTTMDTRYVRKDAIGTAAAKAEGTGNGSNLFTGSQPTVGTFTLTANMLGTYSDASWELLQDVNQFQSFLTDDVLLRIAVLRESAILSGGVGAFQGLLGNVGAGITGVLAGSDNYASELIDASFDVQGALNAEYHGNAAFLMHRQTSIAIRKAQKSANLFEPVFVRVNGKDTFHGYDVAYTSAMPTIAAGNTPVLFGDFKAAYIYGERGGKGVNVKILDQPKALEGLLTVLGYQRVDGKVRRSEAVQAITLHA